MAMPLRALFSLLAICLFVLAASEPLSAQSVPQQSPKSNLSISKRYLSYADSDVIISQALSNTLPDSIQYFSESILYDPNVVEFINVSNGALTPAPDWTIMKSVIKRGSVQISAVSSGLKLLGAGEILQLLFHVLDTVQPYQTAQFLDSAANFGTPGDPIMVSDTGIVRIITKCTSILTKNGIPLTLSAKCVPDPASKLAAISYALPEGSSSVRISLYDLAGDEVQTLDQANEPGGWHEAQFDVSNLPNGTYFYAVQAGNQRLFQMLSISH